MTLNDKLLQAIAESEQSLRLLARKAKVNQTTIGRWSKKRNHNVDSVERLFEALGYRIEVVKNE